MQQGTLQEQKERKRNRFRVAVYSVFGGTILLMTFFLFQGCKQQPASDAASVLPSNPAEDTNSAPTNAVVDTNFSTNLPSLGTNFAVAPTNQAPVYVPPSMPQQPIVPASEVAGATKEYVVGRGDSFYSIAKKLGVKMKDITAANPTVNAAKLKVGQKISVPDVSSGSSASSVVATSEASVESYTVKSGDSLMKIAKRHGASVKELRSLNALKTDKIRVGQKLKLPSKAHAAEMPAVAAPAATTGAAPSPAPVGVR